MPGFAVGVVEAGAAVAVAAEEEAGDSAKGVEWEAGDAEAEIGGFQDEGEFGEFSAALGGEFALAGSLRDGLFFGDWILSERLFLDGLCSDKLFSDRLWARR